MQPTWNDPVFEVASDTAWRAKYRKLQSWYRENVLAAAPGRDERALRGSLLADAAVEADPALNFLGLAEIAAYADTRANEVIAAGGTLERNRLFHNLLSSMPLCFNVFGYLRARPAHAARLLSGLFELPIATIERIEVEWTPEGPHPLGDRTAFDAFVEYRDAEGERGFVGVETKYTEPFSAADYDRESYRALTTETTGFRDGAADRLKDAATNQLWRNALLAIAHRKQAGYRHGHVAVLAVEGDKVAQRAVDGLRAELVRPEELLRAATLDRLVQLAAGDPALADWAAAFRRRYLDLSAVGL